MPSWSRLVPAIDVYNVRVNAKPELSAKQLFEPAQAIIRGEWKRAATALISAAATAATGNPFAGLVAGGASEWFWARAAAQSATERLKAARNELEQQDEAARVAFVQRCLEDGFASARAGDVVGDSKGPDEIAEILEDGLGQVLRSLAGVHDKLDALQRGQAELRATMSRGGELASEQADSGEVAVRVVHDGTNQTWLLHLPASSTIRDLLARARRAINRTVDGGSWPVDLVPAPTGTTMVHAFSAVDDQYPLKREQGVASLPVIDGTRTVYIGLTFPAFRE